MKFKQLSPILWTKDLPGSVSFYTEVLGFSSRSNFPNFVSLFKDEVEIMLIVPVEEPEDCADPLNTEPFFPKSKLTGSIYMVIEEVDSYWEKVKDQVTIKSTLEDREYWMRDFSILDNNGYELVFGQNISNSSANLQG